jgi:gamma-glutamyltranspeptidase / glutathione hydrolase
VLRGFSFLVALFVATATFAQSSPQLASTFRGIPPVAPVVAQHGMVVAQERRAAEIGRDILRRGGNAVDAAVAVGFAMAVTYPRAGNLGGGGFMVIHLAKGNRNTSIDYRETAPAAASPEMFLDPHGEPDSEKSRDSGLALGVPGTVAGLALAEKKYGSRKFTLPQLIAPAIALAADGFTIDDDLADTLPRAAERLSRWPSSAKIFVKDGRILQQDDKLVQPDLASTLRTIAQRGPRSFYEGPIAEKIAAAVRDAGGIMTADDLRKYRPTERAVLRGKYRGYEVIAMPPPSSGGVCLIEMLNILEGYDLAKMDRVEALHLEIEAMRRAYADRAVYMGDPAAVKMPIARLTSKSYAQQQRKTIGPRATPSAEIHPGPTDDHEGHNTTHFSVIDRDGNAVSNTYTLNFSYGVGLVAEGTGVLLNNEMDDFTAKPGTANAYGLVGFAANLPSPGKRPLSSMTPTILLKNGNPVLITGSPGGSRIISTVLQVIVNAADFKMPIGEAVQSPRLHHQWLPDEVRVEPGFSETVLEGLRQRGHAVRSGPPYSSANSIAVAPKKIVGAADSRTRGATAAGY